MEVEKGLTEYTSLETLPHFKLNIRLPIECRNELMEIDDYYGLVLDNKVREATRRRYRATSKGHAFRSYASFKDAYNLNFDKEFIRTESWHKIPKTTKWLTSNLCDEDDMGMVCLHKITAGGWVDWHSHGEYGLSIVHFSLQTNEDDLSEVWNQSDNTIDSMNYPELEGYIFNSFLQHRSTNFSEQDRIHLVVECDPNNERFQNLYTKAQRTLD